MPRIWLKKGRERTIKEGYLWVHPQDVERISASAKDSLWVDVMDSKDRFLGRALFNEKSPIVARIFSTVRREWNKELVSSRIRAAWERRKRWGFDSQAFRVCYGESDGVPGLIVDKYDTIAVIQVSHPALDSMKRELSKIITDLLRVQGVYERSDTPARIQEGLSSSKGLLEGSLPRELWIEENGVRILVDVEKGQKTGHYLDQKRNRINAGPLAKGRQVLDVFCYTGGFGLHCLAHGAKGVVFVDSSEWALEVARKNVSALGAGDRAEFLHGNAFDVLRHLERTGKRFDMVCLDPPAFAPSKASLASAIRGYKELNLRALMLLRPGGILVSSSCSSHVPVGLHLQVIVEAAADAGRRILLLHQWGHDLDHPVLPSHPPSRYLKCHVAEVVEEV